MYAVTTIERVPGDAMIETGDRETATVTYLGHPNARLFLAGTFPHAKAFASKPPPNPPLTEGVPNPMITRAPLVAGMTERDQGKGRGLPIRTMPTPPASITTLLATLPAGGRYRMTAGQRIWFVGNGPFQVVRLRAPQISVSRARRVA